MVLEKLYIADLQKVSGNVDRKICAVGVIKMLTECPILLSNDNYIKIWFDLLFYSTKRKFNFFLK